MRYVLLGLPETNLTNAKRLVYNCMQFIYILTEGTRKVFDFQHFQLFILGQRSLCLFSF